MAASDGVEAVERGLRVLESLDVEAPSLSLAEIARRTGLYKSTILRLVASLKRFEYVVQDSHGSYRLGPATWRLGTRFRQHFDLANVIRPELEKLSELTRETASFYVREGGRRICLYRSEPDRAILHSVEEGARMPLDQGASGKVLMAFGGDREKGDPTVRKQGFAISMGERDPEVAAIAVPIHEPGGVLAGALAVSGLITRFEEARHLQLLEALQASQGRLNAHSGAA